MKERYRAEFKLAILPRVAATAMLALSLLSAPANAATLLHGYLSDSSANQQENLLKASKVVGAEGAITRSDSFATDLQGAWQCVTVVTDSLVDTIPVGQKVVSHMEFVKNNDGRVLARFQQPGWTEAQENITAFSATQYQIDKTNYYYGDRANGAWAARSRDHYQVLEKNRMIAESEVDQYVNGRYAGRYHTRSTLVRVTSGIENVALQQMPDPDDLSGDVKPGF